MSTREKLLYNLVTAAAITLVLGFAYWWFQIGHIPHNFGPQPKVLDIFIFFLVSYVIWHPLVMEVLVWVIASHIKQPIHHVPQSGYRVAFVTTFVPQSESLSLLEKTLPAMLAVDYPHDTWLLDEGDDPAVKALCERLGVSHYSRATLPHFNMHEGKYARKTKGGNHNSWYSVHGNEYDIVAQIDTDYIPSPHFLTRTLGYFRDRRVAFVGTPQVYGNTADSLIARGAAEQTYNFYGPILRGLCGMDQTLLIGANHVMRVAALKDVDHYSAHITEDLLTGMKLHAKGWKSVYVPEVLAVGEGPSTWVAFFNQQMRWAYGCMDILFRHSPRLLRQMNIRQALYYFLLQQHYFSGLAMALGIVGLLLYFFFGIRAAQTDVKSFIVMYGSVLVVSQCMVMWLQRYNIRPHVEGGALIAGRIVSIATWPIFFIAFWSALLGKRLTYKVTPKGTHALSPTTSADTWVFVPHLLIGSIGLVAAVVAMLLGRSEPLMLLWLVGVTVLMCAMPLVQPVHTLIVLFMRLYRRFIRYFAQRFRILDFDIEEKGLLPGEVTDTEKYQYIRRNHHTLMYFSLLSFIPGAMSTYMFLTHNPLVYPLLPYFALTILYFLVSFVINVSTKDFDHDLHERLVASWHPAKLPTVDIFLPTAGEPTTILRNTWEGVREMQSRYTGVVTPYCLDDSARSEVRALAAEFGFEYIVRPNRGEFKKAGNLRHGFGISRGEYIVIFDADFRPRRDFLHELLPYFYHDPHIGIVQSPQYFTVNLDQNWLERGAGAVQELFYRYVQVSRQTHDASICVGSNAIYRRAALKETGGTALIEHSEDVHTGFNLRMKGWTLQYVPVVVSKGLCPGHMLAFFKQQYRWCLGSMSLLTSRKFWSMRMPLVTRLCYFSGFLYYIHTAVTSLVVTAIPIILLTFYHEQVTVFNLFFILPSLVFVYLIFPRWHHAIYGIEAWATRAVYGWAHLFAIMDTISRSTMSWNPSGSKMSQDMRYVNFRFLQIVFNFIPAIVWVSLAVYRMISTGQYMTYLPILAGGLYFLFVSSKITFYRDHATQRQIVADAHVALRSI